MAKLYELMKDVTPLVYSPLSETGVPTMKRKYWDKKSAGSFKDWQETLQKSSTVYVGNLSFYTSETQILCLFSKCGYVRKIVMGLNKITKVPCGFCFVEYATKDFADLSVILLNGSYLEGRQIRVDKDAGGDDIETTRRYGRGESGMQWRDEFRTHYDPERGGEGGGLLYTNGRKRRADQMLNSDDKHVYNNHSRQYHHHNNNNNNNNNNNSSNVRYGRRRRNPRPDQPTSEDAGNVDSKEGDLNIIGESEKGEEQKDKVENSAVSDPSTSNETQQTAVDHDMNDGDGEPEIDKPNVTSEVAHEDQEMSEHFVPEITSCPNTEPESETRNESPMPDAEPSDDARDNAEVVSEKL